MSDKYLADLDRRIKDLEFEKKRVIALLKKITVRAKRPVQQAKVKTRSRQRYVPR
jgi:hypothetical protein